jgi:16S rRNA (guanine(966)-N(2))-methyltransferase RsmD
VRIIGGSARGRVLAGPRHQGLRPTADRVRQALFDLLGQTFQGEAVLDLYAGTGALGLEALSRGAGTALLVDRDPAALELCRKNAATLGFGDRAIDRGLDLPEGIDALARSGGRFDLVFVDPPYSGGRRSRREPSVASSCEEVLRRLAASGILAPGARVVVEHDRRDPIHAVAPGLKLIDQRRFGDTEISVFLRED